MSAACHSARVASAPFNGSLILEKGTYRNDGSVIDVMELRDDGWLSVTWRARADYTYLFPPQSVIWIRLA